MTKTRRMALFAFDGCGLLDVAGPASVFGVANAIARRMAYDVRVVSPHGGLVATSCGMSIATQAPKAVAPETVDTMLVVGGAQDALRRAIAPSATRGWLRRCVRRAARFGSVCSGAYILAELGELDGLRVATHWANCEDLAMLGRQERALRREWQGVDLRWSLDRHRHGARDGGAGYWQAGR